MISNPTIRFILLFVVPMALLILWMGGFFSSRVEPGFAEEEGKLVKGLKTMKVEPTITEEYYTADGSVMANNNAKVSTKIMAKILEIKVKEGDEVHQGQLLAVLDASDIEQNIKEAKAGLREIADAKREVLSGLTAAQQAYKFMKKTYERFKKLYEENALPKQKLEEIETQMIGAKAKVDALKAKLQQIKAKEEQVKAKLKYAEIMKSYAYVYSPFDGVVIKKMADVGDMAAPGMPLFIIGDKNLVFFSQIDEGLFNKVNLGDEFKVRIDTINKELTGRVIEKSNSIDPMTRSFSVKLAIPNEGDISSGMYGKLFIPVKKEERIFIPKSAILNWGQLTAVYRVDKDGILHLTFVKTGEEKGDLIEVNAGLKPGDIIVASNPEKACDGCRIK
jgi:RND family efflux transporter MFP subunit